MAAENKKKKLWILNHYALPPDQPGGTRHFDFAKEISDEYDVTIFASAFDHTKRTMRIPKGESYKIQEVSGVKFIWIANIPYGGTIKRFVNMIDFSTRLYSVAKKFDPPDIILASSVHLFTCLSGYYLARKFNIKWVLEIRDLWPKTLIDMGAISEKHPAARVFGRIEKFLYRKAEKIVVLLPFAGEYITALGIDSSKITWIPNGVRIDKEGSEASKAQCSCIDDIIGNHKDRFIAMYVGSHGPANAIDVIIDAAGIIQEKGAEGIDIVMVGDGPSKQRLTERCQEEDIKNVFFYPAVPKDCVHSLLKHADVLLVAMLGLDVYKYGISLNKLSDYLYAAKPIVFAGSVRNDIVGEYNCGVSVDTGDYEAMAEAVIRFSAMEQCEREYFGNNGLEYLMKHLDIAVTAKRLKGLLAQCMDEGKCERGSK